MVTFGQVRQWDAAPLHDAVRTLTHEVDKIRAAADDFGRAGTPDGWMGEAASAAAGLRQRLGQHSELIAATLTAIRRAYGDTGDAVEGLQHAVQEADGLASAQGFRIADDGNIVDESPGARQPEVERERQQVRAELADRVEQIIRRARDIDEDLSAVLSKAERGEIEDNGSTTVAQAATAGAEQGGLTTVPPPKSGTPADNAG